VPVTGELEAAITDRNFKTLRWVSYAIQHLTRAAGLTELLDDLASVTKTGSDSERRFENLLTEIHAASFLSDTLNETVLEVESRAHKVESPHANPNKSCDIKTATNGNNVYYEVKNSSSEITTSYEKRGVIYFKPIDDRKLEQWIKEKT
jgi:DNA polymerase III delta subunit